MILSNDTMMQTIMFLVGMEMAERLGEIRSFLFSKEFQKSNKLFTSNGLSTYSFLICEKVPFVIGPEEDDDDQELILSNLYLEVSMDGGCAYFVVYIDESSNCRIEGDITEAFMLDETFATSEDLDLEISIIIEDQQNHERFTYSDAYKKIASYLSGTNKEGPDTEEMPF